MKIRRIIIAEPQIQQLVLGNLTRLRRPGKADMASLAPGDLFWVQEPYHLKAKFGDHSPTVAETLGAQPFFATGMHAGGAEAMGLGKRRFARNLLKVWHRQHLVVTEVSRQPLQDITDAEIRAEGFASRGAWIDAWDAAMQMNGRYQDWASNPEVPVFDFLLQVRPAPSGEQQPARDPAHNLRRAS